MLKLSQDQRLDYLIEAFKADSDLYKTFSTPSDTKGKQQLLRSLMNVRPPKLLPLEVLQVQDDYLSQRAKEKGIVTLDEIPVIHDGLSILFPTLNYGVKKVKE